MRYLSLILVAFWLTPKFLPAQTLDYDPVSQKWGILAKNGSLLAPYEFDEIQPRIGEYHIARRGNEVGVLHKNGRPMLPFTFDYLSPCFRKGNASPEFFIAQKQVEGKGVQGVMTPEGQEVLALKYNNIWFMHPDRIVARMQEHDSLLYFFDEKGKLLKQVTGHTVQHFQFDENAFLVNIRNGGSRFVDKNGEALFLPGKEAVWTDKKLTIMGISPYVGMVNENGDTIIPFESHRIVPYAQVNQFVVSYPDGQVCLVTGEGGELIPKQKGELHRAWGGAWLLTNPVGGFNQKLFDGFGRLVQDSCRIDPVHHPITAGFVNGPTSSYRPNNYLQVVKNTKLSGFFRSDGSQILPVSFRQIAYRSDDHALLAELPTDGTGYENTLCQALDVYGEELLPPDFKWLRHTENPRLLYGKSVASGKVGFIDLDKPAAAMFEFYHIHPLASGFFNAHLNMGYALLDPSGKQVAASNWDNLTDPDREMQIAFRKSPDVQGRLVAVAFYPDKPGQWFALNERGEEFPFGEAEILRDVAVETVMEASDSPIPPPVEEPPFHMFSKSDSIFHDYDVEDPVQFPGGDGAMVRFIQDHLVYPTEAKQKGIKGMVVIEFVIEKTGLVSNVKATNDIGRGCAEAAVRVIQSMPRWRPGELKNGEIVRVGYAVPVMFR